MAAVAYQSPDGYEGVAPRARGERRAERWSGPVRWTGVGTAERGIIQRDGLFREREHARATQPP